MNRAPKKITPGADASGAGAAPAPRNPYLPTAVAVIEDESGDGITVDTDSVRLGRRYLDAYLKAYRSRPWPGTPTESGAPEVEHPSPGNVVAIVGEHGTGKTHLLGDLLTRFRAQGGADRHALYVEASQHRSFLSIYQELMRRLQTEHALLERVRDYYVDLAVEDLGRSPIQQSYAEQLREGMATVEDVERAFGLDLPELMAALGRRLQAVTRDPDFGQALSYLLNPVLQGLVESWLRGEPPDPLLVERGIVRAIDTEERALEAIGVFALVYGRRNHRLMLAIDEVDRLIIPAGRATEFSESALKKLLEVFAAARGLLVIAGLPDFLQVLRPDTLQRMGTVIEMAAMTGGQVEEYVLRTHERFLGHRSLEPFTGDALRCVTQISGGVPRQVIRLLQLTFEVAVEREPPVTAEVVLEAAPGLATSSREKVRSAVAGILSTSSIAYEPDRRASLPPQSLVDFWIPFPGEDRGCGLLVADSVLTAADVESLSHRAVAIRDGRGGVLARVVIAGWLPPERGEEVCEAFGAPPLVYSQRTFESDLLSLIRAAGARATGDLTPAQDQIRQVTWQQRNLQRSMDQLLFAVEKLQQSTANGFESLSHRLPPTGLVDGPGRAPELPEPVAVQFATARAAVVGRHQLPQVLDAAFGLPAGDDRPPERGNPSQAELSRLLGQPDAISALGLMTAVGNLINAFESAVSNWYARWSAVPKHERPAARDDLIEMCRRYDELFQVLPLHLGRPSGPAAHTFFGMEGETAVLTELAAQTMRALLASP